MAIVKMKKMSLIAFQSDRERIINVLHKFGVVEISDLQIKDNNDSLEGFLVKDSALKELSELESNLSKIKYAIDFIDKYCTEKKGLFNPKPEISRKQFDKYIDDNCWEQVYSKCRSYDEKLNGIKNEQNKRGTLLELLKAWKVLDVPIETLTTSESVTAQIGTVVVKDRDSFFKEISENVPDSYVEVVNQLKDENFIFAACHKAEADNLISILKKYGWSKVQFDGKGTPAECSKSVEVAINDLSKEYDDTIKEIGSLTEYKLSMKVMFDYLSNEIEKKRIISNIGKTKELFVLQGWIPEEHMENLDKTLRNVTDAYVTDFSDPAEDDDVPTAVKNNKFVETYEVITDQYSTPNYKEVDPNKFITPFYFVFFGMMLSDAGYGAVMTLLCWFIIKRSKPEGNGLKLLKLLMYGGISSIFWGIMFAGYFGSSIFPPVWISPVEDPITLLIFSLVLGIVHIFLGLGIKAYGLIRDGHIWDAIFDIGLWYVLIIGLLMYATPVTTPYAKYIAIAGAVGLVLTQGRSNKHIITKFLAGVLSLYNITGYLGDVLSYSRILALGLASSLIGLVINTMIGMMGGGPVGIILGGLLFIGGHTFNLAINALGAYVHTTRLHYLEFFGKFYEGGGRAFKPLKQKTKFINILEQ